MAGPDLKKWREKLDTKVLTFIKKRAPNSRVMNLRHKPGVKIPQALKDASNILDTAERDEAIIKRSLQRLKKAGKIWCNKRGTPHWEICEEDES